MTSVLTLPNKPPELTMKQAEKQAFELVRRANSVGTASTVINELLSLAAQFPDNVEIALDVLITEEKLGKTEGLDERYSKLSAKAPSNIRVARFAARRLVKVEKNAAALEIIERATPFSDAVTDKKIRSRAELAHDSGLVDNAREIYEEGLVKYPLAADLHASYAKRLRNAGSFRYAHVVMSRVKGQLKDGTAKASLLYELDQLLERLPTDVSGPDERIQIMVALIRQYGRNRKKPPKGPGKTCFITGTLSAAGAERQLSRLAIVLSTANRKSDKNNYLGETNVLVRSLASSLGHDFFLSELKDANVLAEQVERGHSLTADRPKPPLVYSHLSESDQMLISNAPSLVRWSVRELYPIIAERGYRTVSLWQDGAVLFGALAALIAGIPRIQLVFRGLPPNERTYLLKPEYEPLYRELAKLEGIKFMANSAIAARSYEKWLGLDVGRISVLPNGIVPPNNDNNLADKSLWEAFTKQTGPGPVLGKVGRLDTVKRPIDWIRCAGAVAIKNPNARFVVVGDGRLRENCEAEAKKIGIADRILFVGHSRDVGYWLDKMDVLLMTSRFEGLPNVLIEAQSIGTAVVSTPAGGAEECFLSEETGKLLKCLETVDINEVAEAVIEVFDWPNTRGYDPSLAKEFAKQHYSVPASLTTFLKHCDVPEKGAFKLGNQEGLIDV